MESMSRSRLPSKKSSSSSNGYAGKSIYDDVFGGPPQFGVPTLSPRAEDYSEIFESFHSSRASSIPVLDLPVVDGADLSFNVRSSKFDYSEVFGGFNTLDFAVSYEELFNQSNDGDDSSDEDWTPAQSDSLSDGSDPFACPEKNQSLSNADPDLSFIGSEQLNVSYDEVNPKRQEDILSGVIYVNNPQSEAHPIEDVNSHLHLHNDFDLSMNIVGAVTEGKRLRKTMSQPSNSNFGMQTYRSDDVRPLVGRAKKGSLQNEAFISVSNISLRTQPSQVPPPSRPPPPLAVKKGDTDGLGSKLTASKSYAFERMTGESSPPYFDVEIDASSSAAASAAAMKDAVEKAQAKLRSAKELMERKKEVQSRTKLRLESDLKYDREESGMKPYPAEEKQKVIKKTEVLSSSVDGEKQIDLAGKSRERKHGKERKSSHGSRKSEGSAAWTEGSQFYEVVEKEQIKEEKEFLQNTKSCESEQQKKGVAEEFLGRREHGSKIIAAREENQQKADVVQRVEQQRKEREKTVNEAYKCEELQHPAEDQLKENPVEAKQKLNVANGNTERNESDRRSKGTFEDEDYKRELKDTEERAEKLELETKVKQQKEAREREENQKKQKDGREQDMVTMCPVKEDNVKEPKLACEVEQKEKNLKEAVEKKEDESKQRKDSEGEEDEKRLSGASEEDDNDKIINAAWEEDDHGNRHKEAQAQEENEKISLEACEIEERQMGGELFFEEDIIEKRSAMGIEQEETGNSEGLRGQSKDHEQTGKEENERKVNPNKDYVQMEGQKWKEFDKQERDGEKVETPQDTLSCEEDGRTEKELEVVEELNIRVEVNSSGTVDFQHENNSNEGGSGIGIGRIHIENDKRPSEMASDLENPNITIHKHEERGKNINGVNFSFDQKGSKERLVKNVYDTRTPEERDKEERSKRELKLENERLKKIEEERERDRERENERLRKIEEEREREREREKDRMAVDRATLEARERATGEARERAERAAVERATAEFRQRAMAEAREKLEKATAEARLRAEQRGAVERATAESRERAVGKVLAEKAADRFSGSSRSGVLKHSFSFSDLQGPQFQSMGPSSGSRVLHSSVSFGSESAQRCKARLERHRRTAERAANALAEKNKRDLVAQREQAERNRLAENLDAEVKRWSSGKEGNLRALLSTLQYILGPDSGWQPVPLTEVITAVAVKKAYRKATLCVHPDKLQQRGATIHQKYICEKVFDLLKEAWNKFNSEER